MKRVLVLATLVALALSLSVSPPAAATPKSPKSPKSQAREIAELRSMVVALTQQVAALRKRVAELEKQKPAPQGRITAEDALKRILKISAQHGVGVVSCNTSTLGVTLDFELPGSNLRHLAMFRADLKRELLRPGGFARLESDTVTISGAAGNEIMSSTLRLKR